MENSGATVAINDLLVSRHGHGVNASIRVLPAGWPAAQPVRWGFLCEEGARGAVRAIGLGGADQATPPPLSLIRHSWQNVRVKGGFLVSASAVGSTGGTSASFPEPLQVRLLLWEVLSGEAAGRLPWAGFALNEPHLFSLLKVESLNGGACAVEDIFRNGSSLAVTGKGGQPVDVKTSGTTSTFHTEAGERYLLHAST